MIRIERGSWWFLPSNAGRAGHGRHVKEALDYVPGTRERGDYL